ncbi:MAG: hypothetical protein U0796_16760 [Gemmatales bacterium]
MMYDIAGSSRRCAKTGKVLNAGDRHMVVLFERDDKLVREDICLEAWGEPPAGAFAWWQTKVPEGDDLKKFVIDDNLVYDCFTRLEGENEPQKVNFRYVLALWLLRKRKLKFEEVEQQDGNDWLLLREARIKKIHKVLDPHLNEDAIAAVQQEVETMLRAA